MKIEHLGLYVKELDKAKTFFETYFQAQANDRYDNPTTGFSSYFLTFEDGARLEIMTGKKGFHIPSDEEFQLGYHHLAFSLGSQEAVNRLTEKLRHDGFEVLSGPRVTGDGYYESLVRGFEENLIELTV